MLTLAECEGIKPAKTAEQKIHLYHRDTKGAFQRPTESKCGVVWPPKVEECCTYVRDDYMFRLTLLSQLLAKTALPPLLAPN